MRIYKIVAASLVALVVSAGATAAQEEFPEMKLKYAHFVASNNALALFDKRWVELVEEGSGGKIDIEIFWAGSMGGPTEIPDLVGSGAVELGSTALGYFPSEFPLTGVVGNMLRTFDTPADAHEGSMAIFALPESQEELKRANLQIINTTTANPYNLTCTKPIRTMADLKGTRIRANGKYPPLFFSMLGANPQTIAFSEMYQALEKGIIDCAWMSHDVAISSRLHEVARYAIDLNLGSVPLTQLLVNRELFDGLPENVRQLMKSAAEQASAEEVEYLAKIFKSTIKEDMPTHKMEYVHFDDIDAFLKVEPNMPQIWEKDMVEVGLAKPAQEIGEILTSYREKLVK
ncbi:TRAP-type C4-dicarboxylate transport system substrate-binding protein [Rhodoligotrophos appendicifer]|uniref:TRAP transporter substrate-binding protein n=1 Tax=Rhodoligotrophos appendicifer TaxID=987056 RepID=UPI001186D8D1|nr:TRAP transporter substrate-binding protein DctP [Rhodoligotrophos appendicifer]